MIVQDLHSDYNSGAQLQPSGEELKQAALGILEATREARLREARRVLLFHLLAAGSGTIDNVREVVFLPDNISPKLFGAVPSVLADAGIIKAGGYAKTTRPQAHARPVQVWILADRDGAIAWLRDHPELPDHPNGNGNQQQPTLFGWEGYGHAR